MQPVDDPLSDDLAPPPGRPGPSHARPTPFDRFRYGVCYYPEHWDAPTRRDDARRMADAGINVVRMAEFAWNVLEPAPGRFDFALFDATLDALAKYRIDAILCTPTATPPLWLLDKHPEMVRVDARGRTFVHGSRQHASHMHEGFRRESRRITRAMAEHWREDPRVIGWQTDNEFHCHFSEDFSDAARDAFRLWCERTYATVGRLNEAWGTAFWSQTFDAFGHVTLPRPDAPTYTNPAHTLAYYRFLSDAVSRFQRDQIEILRDVQPRWFVTHNGLFGHIDYSGVFGRDLDVLGYDTYPMFHGVASRADDHAFNLNRARAWTGNFVVLEHQAGAGGQNTYMLEQPLPGEMRQQAYRSIARGADGLLFFRWRTCRFGAEQAWLGLIDHDNVARRRYDEAGQLGAELARVGPALLGSHVAIDAAVASACVEANDAHLAYPMGLPAPDHMAEAAHAWMLQNGLTPGCVRPGDTLGGVGLYVIPHHVTLDTDVVPALEAWVEAGGVLVVGARTASRDHDANLTATHRPGVLRGLCGVVVEEYGRLNAGGRGMGFLVGGRDVSAEHWYELLSPDADTQVVARWHGGPFDGRAAVTRREVGKGAVVYVGTYLTWAACDALLPACAENVRRLRPVGLGDGGGVEYVRRDGPAGTLHVVLNNTADEVDVGLPDGRELTRDADAGDVHTLEPFGVAAVLTSGRT